MKYQILLLLLVSTLYIDYSTARRSGGSSRSSSSSSRGRSSSSGSRSYSGSSYRSSQSSPSYTSHSSPSYTSHSSPSYTSHSYPSFTSGSSANNPLFSYPSLIFPSSNTGGKASSSFIRGETSSSNRPASSNTGTRTQPKPSAPIEKPSLSNSNAGSSSGSKPAWANPSFNPKPESPSADKPAWGNPHFTGNTNHPVIHYPKSGVTTRPHSSGSAVNKYNHGSNNTGSSFHNPGVTNNKFQHSSINRTSGIGSFPSSSVLGSQSGINKPSAPYPAGTGSIPQPGIIKPSAPYPTSSGSMPQSGLNKPAAPYPTGTGSMPQPGHTGNIGFNPSVTHPNYNTMTQPNMGHTNYNPHSSSMAQPSYNPHFSQPSYSQPNYGHPGYHPAQPAGYYPQPMYQPAQPSSGPIIVMAGQPGGSSGGRGLGQIVAEAAVFSAVNAGVNRLLDPHRYHHHYSDTASTSTSTSTTHITYNNYVNGQPVDSSMMNQPGLPTGTNPASFPGGYNNLNTMPTGGTGGMFPTTVGSGSPGVYNSGTVGVNPTGTFTGNTNDNTGSTYTPTGNSGTNVPAPGIVTKVSSSNNVTEPPVNPFNDSSLVIYGISNAEIWKLTEDLFEKQEYDVGKLIEMNLQNKTNTTDDVAPKPLFTIEKDAYKIPTVEAVRKLFNVFESDSRVKENRTLERRQKENILLDTMMNTDVMDTTLNWLTNKRFIDPDDFERKDTLGHVWFNLFDGSSSGFERVFVSETLHINNGSVILGVQNWITFSHLESKNRINYAGYVDKIDLGKGASLVKLNYKMNDLVVSNTTILVGTLPDLEMSLYTICFYARPGIECPVSLGGTKFNIYTHLMPYFGKYLIAAAYPSI